jgi:N-acetylglutamate synthase-like GNAT family acetyltransferase
MIERCSDVDFSAIHEIINDAARAYEGVIPKDCWKAPYMSEAELSREIAGGVEFWGFRKGGTLIGVMAIQHVRDVTLIRHAYVRTAYRNRGIGAKLLTVLRAKTEKPILIGTWGDASWAIRFYEKHGFHLVEKTKKTALLQKYWSISPRQEETSVVLVENTKW